MTVKDLSDFVIYAGAFAAALSAIGWLLYRVLWRPFVRTLKDELGATRQTAEAVHAEVTPNSGHSIKDAVERIEVTVGRLDESLDDHIRNHPAG